MASPATLLLLASTATASDPAAVGLDEAFAAPAGAKVVIEAARRGPGVDDAAMTVEVLDREAVRASGAEDLAEALEAHLGVDLVRSFRGAGVRLQGLDPEHVLILVDGQRVPGRVDGVLDLSRIPAERIERIEVEKGAASARYGADALGGVINVITRPVEAPLAARFHGAVGTRTLDGTAEAEATLGAVGLHGRFGYHRADAFDLAPEDAATTGSAFDTWSGDVGARWRPSRATDLRAGVEAWRRVGRGTDVGPLLPSGAQARYARENRTSTGRVFGIAEHRIGATHRLRVDAQGSLFFDDFSLDQDGRDGAGSLDRAQATRQHLAEATAVWTTLWSADHVSTVGLNGLYERMSSERLAGGAGDRGRVGLFAEHEWLLLGERVAVVPGLRVDLDSAFGAQPTPKLAVRFTPAEPVVLRASYGRGFRAPSFRELLLIFENPSAGYVVEGNPSLRPERSHNVSASAQVRLHEDLSLGVEGFVNWLEDLVQTGSAPSDGLTSRFRYVNVARARTYGLEAKANLELGAGLSLELGYAWLDAVDLELDRPLEGRARHRFSYRLALAETPFGLSAWVRGQAVSRRAFYPDEAPDPLWSAPYVTLDARLEQRVSDTVDLFLGGENLTGVGDPLTLTLPPRAVYGGANVTF